MDVTYDESVREYLRTSPLAEEVRVLVACVARGDVPSGAVRVPHGDTWFFVLEESDRALWWRDDGRRIHVESVGEPERPP